MIAASSQVTCTDYEDGAQAVGFSNIVMAEAGDCNRGDIAHDVRNRIELRDLVKYELMTPTP
ncbi:hypothetical protein AGMMS50256_17380 [Betaproteobacteria bacterium]|nr:hypothetical protein AGMMS50256_17380 [Betaproteobacteria bacterium]